MQVDLAVLAILLLCGVAAVAILMLGELLLLIFFTVHYNLWVTWVLCDSWWKWLLRYRSKELSVHKKLFLFVRHVFHYLPDVAGGTEFVRYKGHKRVYWKSPLNYTL